MFDNKKQIKCKYWSFLKASYNVARLLAQYKSYWAAMNKISIYAHLCVNNDFVHDDMFSCVFPSLFLSTQKLTATIKNILGFFLEFSFVLATQTNRWKAVKMFPK